MIEILANLDPAALTALGIGIGGGAVATAMGITRLIDALRNRRANGNGKAADAAPAPPIDRAEVTAFAATALQAERFVRLEDGQERQWDEIEEQGKLVSAIDERTIGIVKTQATESKKLGNVADGVAEIRGYLKGREDLP